MHTSCRRLCSPSRFASTARCLCCPVRLFARGTSVCCHVDSLPVFSLLSHALQAETPSALTSAATAQQTHDGASKLHESPRTAPEPHGPETSANTAVEGPKAEPEPVAQEVAAEPAQDKEAPKATRKRWW